MNDILRPRALSLILCLASLSLAPSIAHANGDPGIDIKTAQTISGGTYTGGDTAVNNQGVLGPAILGGDGALIEQSSGDVNITGGTFTGGVGTGYGGNGLYDYNSGLNPGGNVNVYGGTFTGGSPTASDYDIVVNTVNGGPLTLYGNFVGGPQTFNTSTSGSFTGTLETNSSSATYTYEVVSGQLVLANPGPLPTPEPSSLLSIGVMSLLGIGALAFKKRRRLTA